MITEITASEVIEVLHGLGYRASFEYEEQRRGVISSASHGREWWIYLGDVSEDEPTQVLRFQFFMFVNPIAYPVGKICNEYNLLHSFSSAHYSLDDDGSTNGEAMLFLGYAVSCTGGVSVEWLIDQIEKWDESTVAFHELIVENEESDIEGDFLI